jgi:hypothetical protein
MTLKSSVLFIDIETKHPSLEIYKYNLITKYTSQIDGYITLTIKDFFPYIKNKLYANNNIFNKRLNSLKKNHKYLFQLIISIALFPSSFLLLLINNLWIFNFGLKEDEYLIKFLNLRDVSNILIGDCIASSFLRNELSGGKLNLRPYFFIFWIKFIGKYLILKNFIFLLQLNSKEKKMFYTIETTYFNEAVRRVLLKYNFVEVLYDKYSGGTILNKNLEGFKIRKFLGRKINYVCNYSELEEAKSYINKLTYREQTYEYLSDSDVSIINKASFNFPNFNYQPVAVVYMHAVSDAQYVYGLDCFLDLNDWLLKTIDLLRSLQFNILIKIHPSYFSSAHNYPADKAYLNFIQKIFKFNVSKMRFNELQSTCFSDVFFVHHVVSIVNLSQIFSNHLCITHHGSVACEAALLGHRVICSNSSPYIKDVDSFVNIYESVDEYKDLLKKSILYKYCMSQKQKDSLYKYVYSTMVNVKILDFDSLIIKVLEQNYGITLKKSEVSDYLVNKITDATILNKIDFSIKEVLI